MLMFGLSNKIIGIIGSAVASLATFFLVFNSGKKSAENKQMKEAMKNVEKSKKARDVNADLSTDEQLNSLRDDANDKQ